MLPKPIENSWTPPSVFLSSVTNRPGAGDGRDRLSGGLGRSVGSPPDRDQNALLVEGLDVGAADRPTRSNGPSPRQERTLPRRPEPVDSEIDRGQAGPDLGPERIVTRDVDQGGD